MCKNSNFIFWNNLKKVCYGNTIIKTIAIPLTLLGAQLSSMVVSHAATGDVDGVVCCAAFLLALVVVTVLFQSMTNIALQKAEIKAVHRAKLHFLERFLENPLHKLFQTDYGELIENITADMEKVTNRYIQLYSGITASLLGIIGYLLFLMLQSPIVAGSLLVISLIQMFPPLIVKNYMQVSYDQCEEIEADITNHIVEAVEGFETIKLYGLKTWWQQKLSDYYKKYLAIGHRTDAVAAAQRSMYRLTDNLLQFGTYALMGFYVILGYCSMDTAVQAVYLSSGFFGFVQSLFSTIPDMAVSKNAERRIRKWIVQEEPQQSPADTLKTREICINNVTCCYGERKIVSGIRYQFQSDKNYLLSGHNGAGKTTLLNLIAGLVLPDSGEICTDTFPKLFYIPQQDPEYHYDVPTLFQMFGIFGKEKRERIARIAERFGLTEKIWQEKAICDLSGGERKKVFLSIGFAMEPRWLLLDEPSNNLDSEGKQVLLELIRERKGTILISHDSLLYSAGDCKIRIENGQIWNEEFEKVSLYD